MPFRYLEYNASRDVANVVVDGSPNDGTVLTLTHWPGIGQPADVVADLSAQMAFRFLQSGHSVRADVVTNNHFEGEWRTPSKTRAPSCSRPVPARLACANRTRTRGVRTAADHGERSGR